jgi:hypothetical protein
MRATVLASAFMPKGRRALQLPLEQAIKANLGRRTRRDGAGRSEHQRLRHQRQRYRRAEFRRDDHHPAVQQRHLLQHHRAQRPPCNPSPTNRIHGQRLTRRRAPPARPGCSSYPAGGKRRRSSSLCSPPGVRSRETHTYDPLPPAPPPQGPHGRSKQSLWLAPNLLRVTPRSCAAPCRRRRRSGCCRTGPPPLAASRRRPALVERLVPRLRSRVLSKVGLRPFSTSA